MADGRLSQEVLKHASLQGQEGNSVCGSYWGVTFPSQRKEPGVDQV